MKKTILILLALLLCLSCAAAEESGILGQPFPDFTVTDIDGNSFTLSAALKSHEAVLLNIWATWCPPCRAEFPYLNEVYDEYGDRVAFIALSYDDDDTAEKIRAFGESFGIRFPLGRDEGAELFRYLQGEGVPTTLIVDRFGNAVFLHTGCFFSAGEIRRVLDAFLGEDYTETAVLDEIPPDTSTQAFPAAASRAVHVENENTKTVLMKISGYEKPPVFYVVPDDTAHLRLEITAADSPADMMYYDQTSGKYGVLSDLFDPERNAYLYDQPLSGVDYSVLLNYTADNDPDAVEIYLLTDDAYIEECAQTIRSYGYEVSWEYGEPAKAEEALLQAYVLHTVDQSGAPVPGVYINFCSDTSCTLAETDENGTAAFESAPGVYHVQLVKAPEGYSFDADFDMYTDSTYGEWVVRIRKD